MSDHPDLLTADELAARLGIGRDLVYTGAKSGQLPAQMIGARFYCRVVWVERFEAGEPGFWQATPKQPPDPKKPAFVRSINAA